MEKWFEGGNGEVNVMTSQILIQQSDPAQEFEKDRREGVGDR
jgi:hypothetical protein